VTQAKAACGWLRDLLKESTGKECAPRPVVVFPGWFVEPTAEARNSEVWVLNPKALPVFVQKSKPCYASDEVHLFALHLSRYVSAEEAKPR
jgi:hypothetical protein